MTRRPRPYPHPDTEPAEQSTEVVAAERHGLRGAVSARAAKSRERAKRWNAAMLAEAEAHPHVGTRWGRSGWAFVPATVAVAAIGLAISEGVIAANFAVNDQAFTLHVGQLQGKGLGAVLAAESLRDKKTGVLHAGMVSASLTDVCIVVHQSVLGVDYTITVSSGAGGASGDNLYFDVTNLNASPATLRGAILGESADAVSVNGNPLGGAPGGFGLDVGKGSVTLSDVVGSAYQAQVAGALTLPHLGINVRLGTQSSC
jgi:hypothetical protein